MIKISREFLFSQLHKIAFAIKLAVFKQFLTDKEVEVITSLPVEWEKEGTDYKAPTVKAPGESRRKEINPKRWGDADEPTSEDAINPQDESLVVYRGNRRVLKNMTIHGKFSSNTNPNNPHQGERVELTIVHQGSLSSTKGPTRYTLTVKDKTFPPTTKLDDLKKDFESLERGEEPASPQAVIKDLRAKVMPLDNRREYFDHILKNHLRGISDPGRWKLDYDSQPTALYFKVLIDDIIDDEAEAVPLDNQLRERVKLNEIEEYFFDQIKKQEIDPERVKIQGNFIHFRESEGKTKKQSEGTVGLSFKFSAK